MLFDHLHLSYQGPSQKVLMYFQAFLSDFELPIKSKGIGYFHEEGLGIPGRAGGRGKICEDQNPKYSPLDCLVTTHLLYRKSWLNSSVEYNLVEISEY